MNYTKKYPQVSKAAARAKYTRMATTMKRAATTPSFECGASTWWWGKNIEPDKTGCWPYNPDFCEDYAIFVSSTYHPETTLDRMYKTNCKKW
jgi:hypothetical protein